MLIVQDVGRRGGKSDDDCACTCRLNTLPLIKNISIISLNSFHDQRTSYVHQDFVGGLALDKGKMFDDGCSKIGINVHTF